VTRFGTYYTKPYAEWMAACQKQLAEQITSEALKNGIWCAVEIVCASRGLGSSVSHAEI